MSSLTTLLGLDEDPLARRLVELLLARAVGASEALFSAVTS